MTTLLLNRVPDDFPIDRDDGGFVCIIPVWQNASGNTIMTLDCRLDPMPDHGIETFEFSFGFSVIDLDGIDPSIFTQDRYEVRNYLDGLTTAFVMPTVCAAIAALVDDVQPSYIYRVTKTRNLPQCAIAKHDLVTEAFYNLGYQIADSGTDGFDRTFWLMAR